MPSSPHTPDQEPGNGPVPSGNATVVPRGTLPDRKVTAETIEDAYMSFIFYCNPALPSNADADALREAFRIPPTSAGRSFDIYSVYELVKQFYDKEIKTWTELTIKLGVEPPDPNKDESSQKITQYGVRLKKWMNSLHVKSFFEYLMGIPNDYWTKVPNDLDPLGQLVRDGVAIEDDMALRALLPHIRPKRGRKRPEEGDTPQSAQRLRLSPSSAADQRHGVLAPWSAMGGFHLPAHPDAPKLAHPELGPNDTSHTPSSRWPSSAITPTVRGAFWDDMAEPQSAMAASHPKTGRQRRGAKNVSSAWKPGGMDSGAKTRGRPPINRTPIEGPGFSFRSWDPTQNESSQLTNKTPTGGVASAQFSPPPDPGPPQPEPLQRLSADRTASVSTSAGNRPNRPNRSLSETQKPARPNISLQVPDRPGAPVRLATPPPMVVVNGQKDMGKASDRLREGSSSGWNDFAKEATDQYESANRVAPEGCSDRGNVFEYYFEKVEDRTNVDTLLGFFTRTTHDGDWFDADGNPAKSASMDEATAVVNSTLQNMLKTATSPQAFLINLGALAGAGTLMTSRPKCFRLADGKDCHNYKFEWEYRFGHLKGHFNMRQTVPWAMWKRSAPSSEEPEEETEGASLSAEDWQQKYRALLGEMKKREQELADLRGKVMTSLREDLE